MSHERRPASTYYEQRTSLLSQGDVFRDVPLAYPSPATELVLDDDASTGRAFISGPLDVGLAMLVTPTCSMRAQTAKKDYAHPVRTLVPVRPMSELIAAGIIDVSRRGLAEKRDSLINYMYLPASDQLDLPESMALLYMPVTLHHDMIVGNRISQLTHDAAAQLQRKLAWFASSILLERTDFAPPMD